MKFLHLTVEQFEEIKNPSNGKVWILRLTENDKYELITPYEKYKVTHKWKYPENQ